MNAISSQFGSRLALLLVGILVPLLLFVVLAAVVLRGGEFGWDRSIFQVLYEGQTPWPLGLAPQHSWLFMVILPFLNLLSDGKTLLAIVLLGMTTHLSLARWRAAIFFAGALAIALFTPVLKAAFNRPSPFPLPGDPSFPSGHAVGSMAIAYGLVTLVVGSRWRWLAIVVGALFVSGVAVSIIADGGHWPSDVAAGWLIAIAWVTALGAVMKPRTVSRSRSTDALRPTGSMPRRLGLYVDGPYLLVATPDGPRVAPDPADFPFLTFVCEVGAQFESLVLFGRARRTSQADARLLLPAAVDMELLPYYDDLRRFGQVAKAAFGTMRGFWRGLSRVDVVWVFGPHPFSFLLVGLAAIRGTCIVLGVRQDSMAYFSGRLPSQQWNLTRFAIQLMEACYRRLARLTRATVVGTEIARQYGGARPSLLPMTVSLARIEDVVASSVERDWSGRIELLTVGRIDQEKNPFLVVETMVTLERRFPGRYHLTWVGTGPLQEAVRRRAADSNVSAQIDLRGFIPFGPELLDRYRHAHMFVHVSLTEGVPAVVIEALASGTPVVGTDVGGVRAALENGAAGLLVPPSNSDALVAAVHRIADDPELRGRIVARGLELAREATLDVQARRVARFMMCAADDSASRGREYAYLAG